MANLSIMIDLDGTLKTEHDAIPPFEVTTIDVTSGSKKYTFGARPYTHEFLTEAKKKADLYLGTAAGGGYARRVIKAIGIEDYFTDIISAENFRDGMPCFAKFKNAIYTDGRCQHTNKKDSMAVVISRLRERDKNIQSGNINIDRVSQIGSMGRGSKIRTYNFIEDRVKDERVGRKFRTKDIMRGELDLIYRE